MTIRFGVSPIAWTNDDMPELGWATSLESCLSDVRAVGFEGIELGRKFPREVSALKPMLANFRLELISGWFSGRLLELDPEEEIARMQDHLALLRGMGCQVMVYAEVSNAVYTNQLMPLAESPSLNPGQWREFGDRLNRVADYLSGQGIRLAYHHHAGTVVESHDEIERLMAVTGEQVGIVLDTGHAALAGADPLAIIDSHGPRIVHIHCKDIREDVVARARAEGMSFLDSVLAGVFTVPGDGDIDFGPVMNGLARMEYEGWVVIEAEQNPAKANPRDYAERGLAHLRQLYAVWFPDQQAS